MPFYISCKGISLEISVCTCLPSGSAYPNPLNDESPLKWRNENLNSAMYYSIKIRRIFAGAGINHHNTTKGTLVCFPINVGVFPVWLVLFLCESTQNVMASFCHQTPLGKNLRDTHISWSVISKPVSSKVFHFNMNDKSFIKMPSKILGVKPYSSERK